MSFRRNWNRCAASSTPRSARSGKNGKSRARRCEGWSANVKGIHAAWWEQRIARQKKIDESIAKKADVELLYDRPYEDKSRIRVAGPFTVESLSPHRVVPSSEGELIEELDAAGGKRKRKLPKGTDELNDFTTMILEHLKTSGVQQAKKADRITFTSIAGWPGTWIAAEGRFMEGESRKTRRHLHRPGIRHGEPRRPDRRRARGAGRALRRVDRLRLQFRGAHCEIPEEAAPQFLDDVAPRNGMMPPPNSEMISPPMTE